MHTPQLKEHNHGSNFHMDRLYSLTAILQTAG